MLHNYTGGEIRLGEGIFGDTPIPLDRRERGLGEGTLRDPPIPLGEKGDWGGNSSRLAQSFYISAAWQV